MPSLLRFPFHFALFLLLTIVTQIGGVAWLLALCFRRTLIAFCVIYAVLNVAATLVAPSFGRVAISCFDDGPLQVQSWIYCVLNRNYVTPELLEVLRDNADEMDRQFPGAVTLVLDANFPFLEGFPLLPHLSHDDGEKVDFAFYYRDASGYLPGATRSPIGFFAFEDGPTDCPEAWPTLRWDFGALQPFWHDYALDETRNQAFLRLLSDDERVGRIFLEPHLVERLNVRHPTIGFQGCRAARHDDHIHIQLR